MTTAQASLISGWGKWSLIAQRMCSPEERWDTAALVLKATAALVAAVAVPWIARFLILDAHAKLASGNWVVYIDGFPHPYSSGNVAMLYFNGITVVLFSWGVACVMLFELIQKIRSVERELALLPEN